MPLARAFAFDAYGTLFDVHSVIEACRAVTDDPDAFSLQWRQKQLEYTWLRALMGRYEDFWALTEAALRFTLRRFNLTVSEAVVNQLMDAYLTLAPFPDVRPTLERLKAYPLAILSNGSPKMLEAAVRSSGLAGSFSYLLSGDVVKSYKPNPAVYALGPRALGLPPQEICFVSSNAWDAVGAKAYGYTVAWCNRAGAPMEELALRPDAEIRRLDELPKALGL